MTSYPGPALIYPVPEPFGLFIRARYNDHTVLAQLLAENRLGVVGIVFDPVHQERHEDLRLEAVKKGIYTVLDPCTMELALQGGFNPKRRELKWALDRPHRPSDLEGFHGEALVDSIVEFIHNMGYTAVLAPTHFVAHADDPWLATDARLTRRLRNALDTANLSDVPIYYPLVTPGRVLRNKEERLAIIRVLSDLDIDSLWLRVHQFGTGHSGPIVLRGYIEAARSFHSLGVPVIGEHTGTVGLALLAFGAVGRIENGVTLGEQFTVSPLLKPRSKPPEFLPQARVYLPSIGSFLSRKKAVSFFDKRGMKARFGCQTRGCCQRGWKDMVKHPGRHFMIQRIRETTRLSRVPENARPQIYLEEYLRPATDSIIAAARVEVSLRSVQRRLESWRLTLGEIATSQDPVVTTSLPARGLRLRHRVGA